ncbi:MAG: glycosyltransferase [Planctomycetaceae bacterium]|nr:glycosyltransferase [Planctomycetaceae bacterium]
MSCCSHKDRTVKLCYVTAIPETQFRFLDGQNAFMKAHGFQLHSICSQGDFLHELETRDGVSTYPVSISRKISPVSDFVSLLRLVSQLRSIKPDILHVSTPKAALLAALAGKFAQVRSIIYYARGSATENERGFKRLLYRLLERLTVKLSDKTICVSPSLLPFMRSEGILNREEGIVAAQGMSNGINIEVFDPTRLFSESVYSPQVLQWKIEGRPIIGFVGRLAVDKGIGELETAWRSLKMSHPDARLLLVGGWDTSAPVSEDVKRRLEQDDHVCLTGVVTDVVPWLKEIDILAFPTHGTEGFPNAVAEAAAMEVPVVGSQVIGVVDAIVHETTGLIIPKQDSVSLTTAISEYLDNPEKRRSHGTNARQRIVEKFQRNCIWNGLLDIYKDVLKERGASGLANQLSEPVDDTNRKSQRAA